MRIIKILFIAIFLFTGAQLSMGHINPELGKKSKDSKRASLRMDCAQATGQIDQEINNVRARLLNGGDVWWDGSDGRYIVPKIDPASGLPEVSSIFAGAVWLGGLDDAGNLKVAAQTYGSSGGQTDFWPGPLNPDEGTVEQETCIQWDRFFKVLGQDIDLHLSNYETFKTAGIDYEPDMVPSAILGWPGRGNEFFFDIYGFDLPNTRQGLGAFFDRDDDGFYEPTDGDYPVIEVAGCDAPQYPDEMIFWIYNDAGGAHTQSNGDPIRMEVQVQSFAYATNDEVNNMTFQRYKLINRAIASIDSTFFAMWVDADLGCYTDDYVGCDAERSLAIIYNEDAQDGSSGCVCEQGVNTYCNNIPIVGVDYFRGPLNEFGEELGMSSFTYYNNNSVGSPTPGTTDPGNAVEYYNYLSGSWLDGTPFTFGGEAYNLGSTDFISYAFTDPPNNPTGWSMCTVSLPFGDRRTIQATGPFRLDPGAKNELIVGVVWVPDVEYPCPDISDLLSADELAQGLFDNCFDILDGPDAPDADWIEMDREVIGVLTNDTSLINNNRFESYAEVDPLAPKTLPEDARSYKFEGYKVIQLAGPNVAPDEFSDPDKARVIFNVDIKNEVKEIYNWVGEENPSANPQAPKFIYVPELQTELALDEGIRHTFRINEDQFASGDRRLINHKKYYFSVIAYAHNEFEPFLQQGEVLTGQRRTYVEGRRNIETYIVTPRPITDTKLNATYGQTISITRLDGRGAGNNLLDITDESRDAMLDPNFDGRITYEPGRAPIDVQIYNPLESVSGSFRIEFVDEDLSNDVLDNEVRWVLTDLNTNETVASEQTIDRLNEQIIAKYGFSVSIAQTGSAGDKSESNGAIGSEYEEAELPEDRWLTFIPDGSGAGFNGITNFVRTEFGEPDYLFDPNQSLSNVGNGGFYPYFLTLYDRVNEPFISPAWIDNGSARVRNNSGLEQLNNVDIVFTSDKSKWSRCIVVESASYLYTDAAQFDLETEGGVEQFELRAAPSVGKDDSDGDGLPDPDGSAEDGFAWFPGYAVNVETGERVNIFFGENSTYSATNIDRAGGPEAYSEPPNAGKYPGEDMMWNPNSQAGLNNDGQFDPYSVLYLGGQHFIYVTNEKYDSCQAISRALMSTRTNVVATGLAKVTWTAIPILRTDQKLLSYADGLIPNEFIAKLRVDDPFEVFPGTEENNGYPAYEFTFEDVAPQELTTQVEFDEQLDAINVVPNPYYGYSAYETSQFSNRVKITNLPAECTVTIFSLDGKFIRQYNRNEIGLDQTRRNNPGIRTGQITPDVEWDLRNNKNIPVASGTYLIHVDAGPLGERVIKWFGVARQFDPSGL